MVVPSTAAGKASRKNAQRRWVSSSRTDASRAGHTSSTFSIVRPSTGARASARGSSGFGCGGNGFRR